MIEIPIEPYCFDCDEYLIEDKINNGFYKCIYCGKSFKNVFNTIYDSLICSVCNSNYGLFQLEGEISYSYVGGVAKICYNSKCPSYQISKYKFEKEDLITIKSYELIFFKSNKDKYWSMRDNGKECKLKSKKINQFLESIVYERS